VLPHWLLAEFTRQVWKHKGPLNGHERPEREGARRSEWLERKSRRADSRPARPTKDIERDLGMKEWCGSGGDDAVGRLLVERRELETRSRKVESESGIGVRKWMERW